MTGTEIARVDLEWAAEEVSLSRGEIELEFRGIQDWLQRKKMERKVSLLKWLGFDKPPQHRVRHRVWEKQMRDTMHSTTEVGG